MAALIAAPSSSQTSLAEHPAMPAEPAHTADAVTEQGGQAGASAQHAEGLQATEPVQAAAEEALGQQSRQPGRGWGRGKGRGGRGRGGRGRVRGTAAPAGQGKPAHRQTRGQKPKQKDGKEEDMPEGEHQQEGAGGLGPQRRSLRSRKSSQHTANEAHAGERSHIQDIEEQQSPRPQAAAADRGEAFSSGGVSLSVEWAGHDDDDSDAHDGANRAGAGVGPGGKTAPEAHAKDSSDSDNVLLAGLQQAGRRRSLPQKEEQQAQGGQPRQEQPLQRGQLREQEQQQQPQGQLRKHEQQVCAEEELRVAQREARGKKRGRSAEADAPAQDGTLPEKQEAAGGAAKRGKLVGDDGAEVKEAGAAVEGSSQQKGQARQSVEPLQNGHAEMSAAPPVKMTEQGSQAKPLQPPPPQRHQQQQQQQAQVPAARAPSSSMQAQAAAKKSSKGPSSWSHGPESQQLRQVAARLAAAQREFKEAQKKQQDIAVQVEGYLAHMKTMAMSLELLRETHIGKAVTRISKWAAPEPACAKAAEAAELLCADWKRLLSKEEPAGHRRQPSQEASAEAPLAAATSLLPRKATAAAKPTVDGKQPPAKHRAVADADGAPTAAHPPAAPAKQGMGAPGKAALRQDSRGSGGAAGPAAEWEAREEAALFHKRARNAVRDKAIALLVHALTPPDALPPEEAARRLEAALHARYAQRPQLQQQEGKGAPAENGDTGGHMAAAGHKRAEPGVAYLRRLRVLWEWLLPGSRSECPQLRQRFLHCELAAAELAGMSAEQVAALSHSRTTPAEQQPQQQQRGPDEPMPGEEDARAGPGPAAPQAGWSVPGGAADAGALPGKVSLDEWGAAGLRPQGAPDQAPAPLDGPAPHQAKQTGAAGQEEHLATEQPVPLPTSPMQTPTASQQARLGGGSGEEGGPPRSGWQSAPVSERKLWGGVPDLAAAQQQAAEKYFDQNSQAGILFQAQQPGDIAAGMVQAAAGNVNASLSSEGAMEPGLAKAEDDMDLEP